MSRSVYGAVPAGRTDRSALQAAAAAFQMTAADAAGGDRVLLGSRCRLKPPSEGAAGLLTVEKGVVAIEVTPSGGRRQLLDFLLAGDALPMASLTGTSGYFARAITDATLKIGSIGDDFDPDAVARLADQFCSHVERCNLHRIMIGQLETEARVASFLLVMALRSSDMLRRQMRLDLPMSRDDIADHLSINPDTLSRIMMRFEASGCIRRINRHAIVLIEPDELGQHTPLRLTLLASLSARARLGNGAGHPRTDGGSSENGNGATATC